MNIQTKAGGEDPLVVTQFYYSQTLPYLMFKHHAEIRRRLVDVPRELRQRELAPQRSSRWAKPQAIRRGSSSARIWTRLKRRSQSSFEFILLDFGFISIGVGAPCSRRRTGSTTTMPP
ncbi:hypothetical protein ACVW1A_008300 [Bradyrhizobium sp. LB1.3]